MPAPKKLPWAIVTVGRIYFRGWQRSGHPEFIKRKKKAMRYESPSAAAEAAWLLTRYTNFVFAAVKVGGKKS